MQIHCKYCKYDYDFARYGEECPNCHMNNIPFRSESARRMMGYEVDSLRDRYFNTDRQERRENMIRSGDPLYGKSPLRRMRPYLFVIIFAFAVVMLGRGMVQMNHRVSTPADLTEKPPVSELASVSYRETFTPSGGVTLQILHTGIVPDALLGKKQRGKVQCLFVDVRASVKKGQEKTDIGELYIRAHNQTYFPQSPRNDGADMSKYTLLDFQELWEYGTTAGQLFFYLPADVQEFSFCWAPATGTQEKKLHVS